MVFHNFQNVLSNKSFCLIIIIYLCMYVYITFLYNTFFLKMFWQFYIYGQLTAVQQQYNPLNKLNLFHSQPYFPIKFFI